MIRRNEMQGVALLLLLLSTSTILCDGPAEESCPSKPVSFFEDYEELRMDVQLLKRSDEGYKFANAIRKLEEDVSLLAKQLKAQENTIANTKEDIARLASQLQDQQNTLTGFIGTTQGDISRLEKQLHDQQNAFTGFVNKTEGDISRLDNQLRDQQNALSQAVDSNKADIATLADQLNRNVTRLDERLQAQQKVLAELVNSTKVAFSVYRTSSFSTCSTTIPFDGVKVNLGGGMNATSGTFTAPVAGVYYFSAASHLITDSGKNAFALLVNGRTVATTGHNVLGTAVTVSLSQTVQLAKGDRVNLILLARSAYDRSGLFDTQFNGMLLHELK